MAILFQAIFTWAAPLMALVKVGVAAAGGVVGGLLPVGLAHDFVQDAIFAGIGAFLTFVPQIFILFLVIGALEDSGYLARAAVILHRPLGWFGLSGRELPPAPLRPRLRHPGDDGRAHHRVAPPAADHGDGHPVHLLLGAPPHLRAAHRRLRPGGQPG